MQRQGQLTRLRCRIDLSDIEAMNYWLNEAPMSDPSARNAIVFALQRLLIPGLVIRLEVTSAGQLVAIAGDQVIPLPSSWMDWWTAARQGRSVAPMSAELLVPHQLVLESPMRPVSRSDRAA